MSGGTIQPQNPHFRVLEMVDSIREESNDPWHLAFASHLEKVATALRAIDRELSGSTDKGEAREEIRVCLTDADLLAYQRSTTGG